MIGDLGAGKTCCIQGIAAGLGVFNQTQITSPTFTLINEYEGRVPLYHFDVYRLTHEAELYDLGYEEYFYGNGVTVIEWANRIASFLPPERLTITFAVQSEQTRRMSLCGCGTHYEELVQAIAASSLEK